MDPSVGLFRSELFDVNVKEIYSRVYNIEVYTSFLYIAVELLSRMSLVTTGSNYRP